MHHCAKQGKSFVMDGPPGSGKSTTIANIIAELMADKKSVLFVSEKAVALEVVKSKLDTVGLGELSSNSIANMQNEKTSHKNSGTT